MVAATANLGARLREPDDLFNCLPVMSVHEIAQHSPAFTLLPDPADFHADCLDRAFWEEEILPTVGEPPSGLLARTLRCGVDLRDYWAAEPKSGEYRGVSFHGETRPPPASFANYVSLADEKFVDQEIQSYLARGAIEEWAGPTRRPHLVLPLFVARTGAKPRLIWDGSWLNTFMAHRHFLLNTFATLRHLVHDEALLFAMDHKAGYQHIGIGQASRTFFGLCWRGRDYTFAGGLPFGWAPAPFLYQSFSDCVSRFLLARYSLVTSIYIDDMFGVSWSGESLRQFGVLPRSQRWRDCSSETQLALAGAAAYIALHVQLRAGYFVSPDKGQLVPRKSVTILGLGIDTFRRTFSVPPDKRKKLLGHIEVLLRRTRQKSFGALTFEEVRTITYKLMALSPAVPPLGQLRAVLWRAMSTLAERSLSNEEALAVEVALRSAVFQLLEARERRWLRPGAAHLVTTSDGTTVRWPSRTASGQTVVVLHADGPRSTENQLLAVLDSRLAVESLANRVWHWYIADAQWAKRLRDPGVRHPAVDVVRQFQHVNNAEMVFYSLSAAATTPWSAPSNMVLVEAVALQVWEVLGPFSVDVFADHLRALRNPNTGRSLPFVAMLPCRGAIAVDAMAWWCPRRYGQERGGVYAFPPPKLVDPFLELASRTRMKVTIVAEEGNFRSLARYGASLLRCTLLGRVGDVPFELRSSQMGHEPSPVALRSPARAWTFDFTNCVDW